MFLRSQFYFFFNAKMQEVVVFLFLFSVAFLKFFSLLNLALQFAP